LALWVFLSARGAAPGLFDALTGSDFAWPLQLAVAGAAIGALYHLFGRRPRRARWYAAFQVGLVIVGWGLSMDHHFVRPDVSVATAAAPPAVLRTLTIVLGGGSLALVPALAYLYRVFKLSR
jgi:cytochrome d ubiquinol oxidase subunit II